mgnify:CR=1 FL=1
MGPGSGIRAAGEVAAHDDLDREHVQLLGDCDIPVRHGYHLVGDNISRPLKPELSQPVEHLTLEGNRSKHVVEGALAIRGDEDSPLRQEIYVPHLALTVLGMPAFVMGVGEAVAELVPELILSNQ